MVIKLPRSRESTPVAVTPPSTTRARDSTVYGGWSTSAKHASKGANRQVVLYCTPHAAARSRGEGGRRDRGQGDAKGIRKKITKMKMRLIKDALIKASGRAQG